MTVDDADEPLLHAVGFEKALIGLGRKKCCEDSLVYDYDKCVAILMDDGMDHDEAVEWMEVNVLGAYVGPTTPIFVHTDEDTLQDLNANQ